MLFRELAVGARAQASKTFTGDDIDTFIQLTGDTNPMHVDGDYATASRFGGRIAHGMLTAGLISTVLGRELPGTGAIYLGQTLRFTAPVRPGDTITAEAVVLELLPEKRHVRISTRCSNQRGESVIEGEARMLLLE
ncbi:MAG: MaoC family dehydratase [Gemmatimonadota bacterium]